MNAVQIRADLQSGSDLNGRRVVSGLAIFSNAVLSGIALYQMGIVKHLPLPGTRTVNGSVEAYATGVPDALLGMASYAVTAILAGFGPADRASRQPWIPLALAAKVTADAAIAANMTRKSWRLFGRLSVLSALVTAATALALPFALPDARRALGSLRRH